MQIGLSSDKISLLYFNLTLLKGHIVSKLSLETAVRDWLMSELTDVGGEFIRKNVIENEKGIKLHLDIQIIDIKTCKPIPNVAMEIWGANASESITQSIIGQILIYHRRG